jgi:hypothetical protein
MVLPGRTRGAGNRPVKGQPTCHGHAPPGNTFHVNQLQLTNPAGGGLFGTPGRCYLQETLRFAAPLTLAQPASPASYRDSFR